MHNKNKQNKTGSNNIKKIIYLYIFSIYTNSPSNSMEFSLHLVQKYLTNKPIISNNVIHLHIVDAFIYNSD